jgi:sigma-B regulation protein RsbU (phosphoserine phosphatase)
VSPLPAAGLHPSKSPRAATGRILLADDQPDILTALRLLLKAEGYETETVDSPPAVLAAVEKRQFDLVLMDLNYARDTSSGREGLELLPQLRALHPSLPVVVMTAWGSIELAVEAMRRGATDFVTKPWGNAALLELIRSHSQRPGTTARPLVRPRWEHAGLAAAMRVQARMRPQSAPPLQTLEYAGQCAEAEGVGGDGFDFIDLGPGRLGLFLADVSGKGVPAALLMAHLQATVRSLCRPPVRNLPALLCEVNRIFLGATASERHATAFFGVYDDEDRRLRYVNCGHNPPFLLRRDGFAQTLQPTATVLGLMEDWRADEVVVTAAPGDTLLIYSDGVTEAGGGDGEEFGEARLLDLLRRLRHRPVTSLPADLLAAVDRFVGRPGAEDDRTVIAARAR